MYHVTVPQYMKSGPANVIGQQVVEAVISWQLSLIERGDDIALEEGKECVC